MWVVLTDKGVLREARGALVRPTVRVWLPRTSRRRRGSWSEREVMPGYALLPALPEWSTRLKSRCLKSPGDEEPYLLSTAQVSSVLAMPDQYERRCPVWYAGAKVTICLGPLDGWIGTVLSQRGENVRVRVGADTEVTVSALALE